MKIEKYKEQARKLFESYLRESNFLTEDVHRALQSDDAAFLNNWSSSLDNLVIREVTRTYLTTRENLEAESTLLDSAERLRLSSLELDQQVRTFGRQVADLHIALQKLAKTSELVTKHERATRRRYRYDA